MGIYDQQHNFPKFFDRIFAIKPTKKTEIKKSLFGEWIPILVTFPEKFEGQLKLC